MKKETKHFRALLADNALYYIYSNISAPLSLQELAKEAGVSAHHFHRIFKEEQGQNLYETIKSIRLQKAANLLLSNHYSTISEVAQLCGYSSSASFIKAFKGRFHLTPREWRYGGHRQYAKEILSTSSAAMASQRSFLGLEPTIKKIPAFRAVYLRHKGYNKSIALSWQKLMAWGFEHQISSQARQIGIHHDNPSITPLAECRYIAALEVEEGFRAQGLLGVMEFPPTLCAVFEVQGRYGDVLGLIDYVYHEWLPQSGYEAKTLPAFALYQKNHFLDPLGNFQLDFCLPVGVV
ncbi:AraC family transcriptional regulator [Wolinella succinogenes]|uniref:AraC family transcriptional regulator n=1 Tax=Wolinella succinogenes TaxID=844 RepID=UPI00240A8C86|nr:GyrI-like domain-containing protein [Wolinella succinogenes]